MSVLYAFSSSSSSPMTVALSRNSKSNTFLLAYQFYFRFDWARKFRVGESRIDTFYPLLLTIFGGLRLLFILISFTIYFYYLIISLRSPFTGLYTLYTYYIRLTIEQILGGAKDTLEYPSFQIGGQPHRT